LVNKLLHHPLQAIKIAAKEGNTAAVDAIRQAFGLHLTGRYGVREHPFAHPASAARVQETETEESRTANTITLKGHLLSRTPPGNERAGGARTKATEAETAFAPTPKIRLPFGWFLAIISPHRLHFPPGRMI
jgi:hypothetical protein